MQFFCVPATAQITAAGTTFNVADMPAEDQAAVGRLGVRGVVTIENPNWFGSNECPFERCPGRHAPDSECNFCEDGQFDNWKEWHDEDGE